MILVDNSIWGTFARVEDLSALFDLLSPQTLALTPTVLAELRAGAAGDAPFLQAVIDQVENGSIQLVALTPAEVLAQGALPDSFGAGERESVAVAQERGAVFLTNDKRARNFCREKGITVYDLADLLRALWQQGVRTKAQVRQLLEAIETEEQIVFRNRDAILSPSPRSRRGQRRQSGRRRRRDTAKRGS